MVQVMSSGAAGAVPEPPGWQSTRIVPQYVGASGTTFAYAELGTGDPLLLLNGTGSPMAEWDPALLHGLSSSRRVIVIDYPGLGLSGPAPARWRFDRAADWVSEFLAEVSPGRPVDVLGWSMGGFIAQQLAIRHPGRIRRLVLAGTNPGGDSAVLGPAWVQEADSDPDAGDATYLRTNYPPLASARAAGRAFLRRLSAVVDSGAYPHETVPARTYAEMVAAEDPWLRSNDNARSLGRIGAPTLVVTGRRDVITPAGNSRRIAAAIPGSRLVLIPRAGHSFLFQRPRVVSRLVLAFLGSS